VTSTVDKRYSLTAACAKCPFRTDVPKYLRPERAREIARSIQGGSDFPCHVTTVQSEDEDGMGRLEDKVGVSRVCAGAIATMEREGNPNQMLRIAERIGLYNPEKIIAADLPVYDSLNNWVRSYFQEPTPTATVDGEILEYEHCGVVGEDCEDPAGYAYGSSVEDNDDEPTCNPFEDNCYSCGNLACAACRSDQWDDDDKACVHCAGQEED
jgi:hypothetical protein